uniref:Tubulin-specific chaperone cofactor E-like protein n=1 Tax=Panagrolaimus superbus TaxID=310955 RepID=A0A914ZA80_9BILA
MPQAVATLNKLSLEDGENSNLSTSSETDTSSDEDEFSLLYNMEKKYLEDQEIDSSINIFGTSPCKLASERHLGLLVLNRMNIAKIGDEQKLALLVGAVSDVDLAFNDIKDWKVIKTILNCMPQLRRLNLSHNPLDSDITEELPTCSYLTSLSLNGVNLPLESLSGLCSKMPQLQEIHLNENDDYANVSFYDTLISKKVQFLQLNACNFNNWNAVMNLLRAFPNVQRLFLSNNQLGSVSENCSMTGASMKDLTSSVRFLSIQECHINEWTAIESFENIGQLEELKVLNNPLFNNLSNEERYHLVIGRLRNLKILNGSPINDNQREDSERFFVRYYQGHNDKPNIWHELVTIHGNLDELVEVDFTPKKYASVTLRCEEKNVSTRLIMRLNKRVSDLMKFSSELTNIPFSRLRIFYHDKYVDNCGPTELRFPNQFLTHLHIEDGDEFLIQSKSVPPEKSFDKI